MAIRDYKKRKVDIKKWDSVSHPLLKLRRADIGESRSTVINADKALKKKGAMLESSYAELFASNKKWYVIADKLIKLQADHKAAVKAKDKSKSKELAKEIGKLDTEIGKLEAKFSKTFLPHIKNDGEVGDLIYAIKDLP